MFSEIVVICCALSEQIALNGDSYLVVLGFVYSLKTIPDFVSSIKSAYVYHLILSDVIGDYIATESGSSISSERGKVL